MGFYRKPTYTFSSRPLPARRPQDPLSGHVIEYAKTSKAQCRGPDSCNHLIRVDALRYGVDVPNPRVPGETMTTWRHWDCVTPDILKALKSLSGTKIRGWKDLRASDKEVVKKAMKDGHVAPPVVPSSSQTQRADAPKSSSQAGPSQPLKRKISEVDVESGQNSGDPAMSQPAPPSQSQSFPTSTQALAEIPEDEDSQDQPDEVYVSLPTKVVGVRFYTGMVGIGEMVSVQREPTNRYDANAIRILNATGTQVGHLSRAVAGKLAPLMDGGTISVEGIMAQGNMVARMIYDLSITLNICGPSNPVKRTQIEPLLIWATPGQRGFPPRSAQQPNEISIIGTNRMPGEGVPSASQSRQPGQSTAASRNNAAALAAQQKRLEAIQKALELNNMMSGLTKVDDVGRRSTVLDTLCAGDILDLPLHPDPPSKSKGDLNNDLLKHQSQGLLWCIQREYPELPKTEQDAPVQFWKYAKNNGQAYYLNTATHTPQSAPPLLGRGAIMADSMGLGKTLTMLALIVATLTDIPEGFSNATLIVVPLSVMSNWQSQIEEHVAKDVLSLYAYHGASARNITTEKLSQFSVILTTFQTLAQQFGSNSAGGESGPKKKKARVDGGLFGVKWKRVILDEGHTIRNVKAKLSQAVCGLEAERRWVVTGTPIINSPNDLGSLLKFLRVCTPLDQPDFFNRTLARPLAQASPEAVELLKTLMNTLCLRRTKEMQDKHGQPLVPLPPVDVTIVRVTLAEKERELYDNIFRETQERFTELVGNPTAGPGPAVPAGANVLSMLTRLRQLILHPSLIPTNYLEELRAGAADHDGPTHNLSSEEKMQLQQRLFQAVQDNEECSVCFDILNEPRILPCTHYFCLACITEVINRQNLCPMDRRPIALADLLEAAPPPLTQDAPLELGNDDDDYEMDAKQETPSSSKIDHLISLLKLIPSSEKSLVFSQFTGFLDLIAAQLDRAGIAYARFDGSMSARRRQEVLAEFSVPLEDAAEPGSEDEAPVSRSWLRKGKFKAAAPKNPAVLLISLKAGALGLNLTVASRVFLMDPWWQSAIELQAIDRVNRIGQTKNVYVYQMVAEDTVEARVLAIQERKKLLIEQAFSGTRRNETHREKKEARLQDLVEVFGAKRTHSA